MANTVLGIDLGTTYSCVAYLDQQGNPVVAHNGNGNNTTPSVVHFSSEDEYEVGQEAKDESILDPDNTVQFVKRSMGEPEFSLFVGGRERSADEISSFILRKVVKDAVEQENINYDGVVVTVPAYFGDAQRQATKNAAEIAGLNLYGLLQEPIAAAISYGALSAESEDVLVYDLGGGTFDITAISIDHGDPNNPRVSVAYQDGDAKLGGVDWDKALMDTARQKFCEEKGIDEDSFNEDDDQALQIEEEKQKKALSNKSKVRIMVEASEQGLRDRVEVTREEFDAATSGLLGRTLDMTEGAISAAAAKGCNVTKILLVGGSSRMPQVKEGLEQRFPQLELQVNDPDEAVAKGAAIWAAKLATGLDSSQVVKVWDEETQQEVEKPVVSEDNVARISLAGSKVSKIDVETVTSKSYGLAAIVNDQPSIYNLIQKNMRINHEPGQVGRAIGEHTFGTHEDGQTSVDIRIFENDESEQFIPEEGYEAIKEASLEFDSPRVAGYPVKVIFSLDEEGLLTVTACDGETGKEMRVELTVSGLSKDEVKKARSRALQMKMGDE